MTIKTIRIQHGKANALDLELCTELETRMNDARDADAVILTASGTIFSAGVDLVRLTNEGAPYVPKFIPALSSLLPTPFPFPPPVLSPLNRPPLPPPPLLSPPPPPPPIPP